VFIYFDIKNNKNIRRSIFVILFHFILISPQLYMNLQWSGYPVLNSRMAQICEKIGLKPMGGGK